MDESYSKRDEGTLFRFTYRVSVPDIATPNGFSYDGKWLTSVSVFGSFDVDFGLGNRRTGFVEMDAEISENSTILDFCCQFLRIHQ